MEQKPSTWARHRDLTRRDFFGHVSGGICGAALASLMGPELFARLAGASDGAGVPQVPDLRPRPPHFAPKATNVIQLFMNGGPSQMDLFDPKPELDRRHGESLFDQIAGDVEHPESAGVLMRSPFKFAQYGDSGMWVSEVMPHFAKHVDTVTMIRSMYTSNVTHEPAIYKIQSGQMLPGYPTVGAWVTYGLGTENQNLPAYVVLDDPLGLPVNGIENWQSGFLPPVYQGTRFRSKGSPVLDLQPDYAEPERVWTREREVLAELDRIHKVAHPLQAELDARIANYELAARMQMSATDALDFSQETAETLEMYGIGEDVADSYGRRCLMARRLVERGVRFVQLFINSQIWDNHRRIGEELRAASARTDKPVAGLLQDLQQRGLLDSTLVIWCGEFGRLPIAELDKSQGEASAGRDHNKNAFSLWMAGPGLKPGTVHGATDEVGFASVENKVSVPDWHATILHLLGLDFNKLSVNHHGLQERLTGVFEARVVTEILS
jgi:hypothetical protein